MEKNMEEKNTIQYKQEKATQNDDIQETSTDHQKIPVVTVYIQPLHSAKWFLWFLWFLWFPFSTARITMPNSQHRKFKKHGGMPGYTQTDTAPHTATVIYTVYSARRTPNIVLPPKFKL